MYLLPITTYFDYLRASKKWTMYTGGTVLLGLMLSSPKAEEPKAPQWSLAKLKVPEVQTEAAFSALKQDSSQVASMDNKHLAAQQENLLYEEKFIIEDEQIPFTSEQQIDFNLVPGQLKIVSEGAKGLKRNVLVLKVIGDQVVKREVVFSQVLSEPIKKIVVTNPPRAEVSRGQSLPAGVVPKAQMEVESTAYTFSGHNTATGVTPRVGIVAVDPKIIPLGTKLFIEGYGYAIAADTGGAIKGKKIDVFFNTVKECIGWGRRRAVVYILGQ